jgi:putative membrane protein
MSAADARREPFALYVGIALTLIGTGVDPVADRLTWCLETFPVLLGLLLLAVSYRRFPLTPLVYQLLALVGATASQIWLVRYHDRELRSWVIPTP